jgi:hypothetical protein
MTFGGNQAINGHSAQHVAPKRPLRRRERFFSLCVGQNSSHAERMALVKMPDVSFNPIQTGRLSTHAVMQNANLVAHLAQQTEG